MASSSEAFAKFLMWKNSRTWLKVTVIENGETVDILECTIFGVDAEASQVGISLGIHRSRAFDVGDTEFSVELARVVASRHESDWLVFEELGKSIDIEDAPIR